MKTSENKIIRYKDDVVSIKLLIPSSYPECENVLILNLTFHNNNNKISNINKELILNEIHLITIQNIGNEILFDVFEYLRGKKYEEISSSDFHEENNEDKNNRENKIENNIENEVIDDDVYEKDEDYYNLKAHDNLKNNHTSENEKITIKKKMNIFHGEQITEQKSRFISHFAYVTSTDEVKQFREEIVTDKKYGRATHNIFAYRFICPTTGG